MSYILDTLKKLEREKSEFNNELDLKKLILKDTSEADHTKMLKKRSHILTFLILAIAVFFFLNFSVFKFSLPSTNSPTGSNELRDLKQTQTTLAPETSNLVSNKSKTKKEASTKKLPVPDNLSDNKRLDYIEQPAQQKQVTNKLNKNERPKQIVSSIISRGAIPRDIADIKISGIVFFGDGVSLNYAIASYKGKNQVKMKEGDRLGDIEVLKIQSEKILLMFQNKIFEKKLGS